MRSPRQLHYHYCRTLQCINQLKFTVVDILQLQAYLPNTFDSVPDLQTPLGFRAPLSDLRGVAGAAVKWSLFEPCEECSSTKEPLSLSESPLALFRSVRDGRLLRLLGCFLYVSCCPGKVPMRRRILNESFWAVDGLSTAAGWGGVEFAIVKTLLMSFGSASMQPTQPVPACSPAKLHATFDTLCCSVFLFQSAFAAEMYIRASNSCTASKASSRCCDELACD